MRMHNVIEKISKQEIKQTDTSIKLTIDEGIHLIL
jgi:hypothetical protein